MKYKGKDVLLPSEKEEYISKTKLLELVDDFYRRRTYTVEDVYVFSDLKEHIKKEFPMVTGDKISQKVSSERKQKRVEIDEQVEQEEKERRREEYERDKEYEKKRIERNTIGVLQPTPVYEDILSGKITLEEAFPPITMQSIMDNININGYRYTLGLYARTGKLCPTDSDKMQHGMVSELMLEDRFEKILDVAMKKRGLFATPESREYFSEIDKIKPNAEELTDDGKGYLRELLFKKQKNRLSRLFLFKGLKSTPEEVEKYRKENPDSFLEYGDEKKYEFSSKAERFARYRELEQIVGTELDAYPRYYGWQHPVHVGRGKYKTSFFAPCRASLEEHKIEREKHNKFFSCRTLKEQEKIVEDFKKQQEVKKRIEEEKRKAEEKREAEEKAASQKKQEETQKSESFFSKWFFL